METLRSGCMRESPDGAGRVSNERKSASRRTAVSSYDDGTVQIDFARAEATIHGEPVHLNSPEYRLLTTLVLHQGEIFTPEKLMKLDWGVPNFPPQNVAYTVMCLRHKLGRKGDTLIETVRGFGYVYRSRNR